MVERSRPTGMPPSTVVALWKDPTRGLREISLDPGADGVLMSVAATRARRRCADGRTPVDNSAGLMVAGVLPGDAVPGDGRAARRHRADGRPAWRSDAAGPHDRDRLVRRGRRGDGARTGAAADELIADARPGAPWRRDLDLPEPSAPLADRADRRRRCRSTRRGGAATTSSCGRSCDGGAPPRGRTRRAGRAGRRAVVPAADGAGVATRLSGPCARRPADGPHES